MRKNWTSLSINSTIHSAFFASMGIVTKRKSADTKLDLADDSSQMSHLLMRILPLNPDR